MYDEQVIKWSITSKCWHGYKKTETWIRETEKQSVRLSEKHGPIKERKNVFQSGLQAMWEIYVGWMRQAPCHPLRQH